MAGTSILFVCLGNICRSPTAEGIFRQQLEQSGLSDQIMVDSAGTSDWHIGSAPDPRAQSAALQRGYDISGLQARQAITEDFTRFDYVIAMDFSNQQNLLALADSAADPLARQKVSLMLSHHSHTELQEVPDPYFGGEDGFDPVIDLLESACAGLLDTVRHQLSIA